MLVFAVLVIQLARVQIMQGQRYKLLARTNLIKVIPSLPARGLIFDRVGRPLVANVPVFDAVVVPSQLPKGEAQDAYYALQADLGVPAAQLENEVDAAAKKNGPDLPVTIKAGIDQTTALKLAQLRSTIPAVDVQTHAVRNYTMGSLVSRVLGYVGKVDANDYKTLGSRGYLLDDQLGKSGIELSYEDKLRGTLGERTVEVDASEHELRTLDEVPPQPGDNITLSIDTTLQQGVTDILARSLRDYQSPSGVAMMMDVHTGEILAYVSLPTYDDNLFSSPIPEQTLQKLLQDPGKPLVDHAISDQYPPGSTIKEITGLAALQEGVATPNTTIVTNGKLVVADQGDASTAYTFPDWMNLGTLNFIRGVAMSSDVYFYCLSGGCPQLGFPNGLGNKTLASYDRMFGLGSRTGIDLPDEVPGIVPDQDWKQRTLHDIWVLADTYYMGIGEEYVAATPVQMLRVVAAIANGGDLLHPHLVHEIRDANGNVVPLNEPNVVRHLPISEQNIETMRQGMLQVVESGSATQAQVPGVRIAGKSGTAEYGTQLTAGVGEAANGTYNESGWFVSYAPYDNPQVALVVFHRRGGGAATAAPVSSQIWNYYFNDYLPSRAQATAP